MKLTTIEPGHPEVGYDRIERLMLEHPERDVGVLTAGGAVA